MSVWSAKKKEETKKLNIHTHSLIHTFGGFLMVRMDGAEARKVRIEKIARSIQAALFASGEIGAIPLKKTVAKLSIETGLTQEKLVEYLMLLENGDQFTIDNENDKIKKITS